MAFKSSRRRPVIAMAVILLLVAVWFCPTLTAQTAIPPVVTSQAVAKMDQTWAKTPGANGALNMTNTQIWEVKMSHHGDVVAWDGQGASLYQFPADGSGMKIIAPKRPNVFGADDWTTGGFTFDKDDTLYISNRWTGYSVKIPYNEEQKTWIPLVNDNTKWAYSVSPGGIWFSASAIAYVENDTTGNGNFFIGDETGAKQIFQYKGDKTNGIAIVAGLKIRPMRVIADKGGNVYFTEDWSQGGVPGVYRIPRGVYSTTKFKNAAIILNGNKDGVMELAWPKCGPDAFEKQDDGSYKQLPCQVDNGILGKTGKATGLNGVSVDEDGNVYLGSQDDFNSTDATNKMTGGIFKISVEKFYDSSNNLIGSMPNAANQFMLAPIPPQGSIAIAPNGDLFVPVWGPNSTGGGGWNGFVSLLKVNLGSAALGASPLGQEGPPALLMYSFNTSVTPDGFVFSQAGKPATDFAKALDPTVGACTTGTTFTQYQRCTVNLALNSQLVGTTSGVLTMTAGGNPVGRTYVHGIGQGAALAVMSPVVETAIRSGVTAPSQVATDRWGNFYVADAGAGKVLQYPKGASESLQPTVIGTGFTAPTGVAVDGAGNVFVADSGKVIEVPASGGAQVVVQDGLGTKLGLGADAAGNIYVADPDNHRVVEVPNPDTKLVTGGLVNIGAGFTAPTAVAADDAGNVFVVDGATLTKVFQTGGQTPITSELLSPVGVALDASGAVYVAQAGGVIRIPYVAGSLDYTKRSNVGLDITAPNGVAVDPSGIIYIADGGTPGVVSLGIGGAADFGYVALGKSGIQSFALLNIGNQDLTFSSPLYASAGGSADFAIGSTGDTCSGAPVPAGFGCSFDIALTPTGSAGPRLDSGKIQSNAANGDVTLNLTGNGSSGAEVTVTITNTPAQPVYPGDVTVTVAVAPASGTGEPTGKLVLYVDGQPTSPVVLQNGTAQFALKKPNGGDHALVAKYYGDLNFGATTSATLNLTIGRASTTTVLANPPKPAGVPGYFVLYQGGYNLQVKVTSAAGLPTGTVSFREGTTEIGTGTLDANGNAVLNTNALPLGTHAITAVYVGDPNFSTSNSAGISFQIVNPSVAITTPSTDLSLKGGIADGVTVSLVPLVGFNRTVQLACVNVPQYSECTFDWPTVSLADGNIKPVQILISTNVPVNVTAASNTTSRPASGLLWPASTLAIGLVGLVFGKKTKYNGRVLMMICALLIISSAVVGMSACSNSSYTKTPDAPHVTTPAGTTVVTITGTDTTTHQVVTLPFQLNVTVAQ